MYTDLAKIKETSQKITKGTQFYLLKDGRIAIYTYEFVTIYNMDIFKEDLTINETTFPSDSKEFPYDWGELVCITELKNGYLVLGFGRAYGFTNLIVDIKDNKPTLKQKLTIENGDFCCRNLLSFTIADKEYFIAGDFAPQIYDAETYIEIAKLNINIFEIIQIKNSNLLAYINGNNLEIIDLSDIEKEKKEKKIIKIKFDKGDRYSDLIQLKDKIVVLDENIIQIISMKNDYDTSYIELNKDFYSLNKFITMCKLPNEQILCWSTLGDLIKVDVEKKEILQKIKIEPKSKAYFWKPFAYKDKYLLFSNWNKLYEIKYDEKEEIKNYEEIKPEKTEESFLKEQDNIVKKIIEEKNLKKDDEGACRAPYTFYNLYRYNSLKKEFPTYNEGQIFDICYREYKLLKPENKEFFQELSKKDGCRPNFI